jgi:AcrR family transcriptional regulator
MGKGAEAVGLREMNKQDKLQRIKKAALDLFIINGFDETTTREIAARADVAMGTVFIYAENKRDLLFLIVNEDLEDCIRRAAASVDPKASLLANLLTVLRIHYAYFARNPVISRAALREMYFYQSGKQSERFLATRDRLRTLLARLIAQAVKDRQIATAESPEVIAQAIFAIYQVDIRLWLSGEKPRIGAGMDLLRRKIELVIRGLNPEKSALGATLPKPAQSRRAARRSPSGEA